MTSSSRETIKDARDATDFELRVGGCVRTALTWERMKSDEHAARGWEWAGFLLAHLETSWHAMFPGCEIPLNHTTRRAIAAGVERVAQEPK